MKHAVEHYFGGGSELLNMHERMADLLLIALSSSFEDAGDVLVLLCLVFSQPASWISKLALHTHILHLQCLAAAGNDHRVKLPLCHADLGIDMEERGLVVNWSTFRFAFCQGGDGESDMSMDVQDLAMFVRDPGSVVTCILLPLSASMHMHQQVCRPLGLHHNLTCFVLRRFNLAKSLQAAFLIKAWPGCNIATLCSRDAQLCLLQTQIPQAENQALRVNMTAAAILIQRWWRHVRWKRAATKRKRSKYGLVCSGHTHHPLLCIAMVQHTPESQEYFAWLQLKGLHMSCCIGIAAIGLTSCLANDGDMFNSKQAPLKTAHSTEVLQSKWRLFPQAVRFWNKGQYAAGCCSGGC